MVKVANTGVKTAVINTGVAMTEVAQVGFLGPVVVVVCVVGGMLTKFSVCLVLVLLP